MRSRPVEPGRMRHPIGGQRTKRPGQRLGVHTQDHKQWEAVGIVEGREIRTRVHER